jgi:hypothetical protein
MKKYDHDLSTNGGIENAIDEAIDISRLSDTELYNLRVLMLQAYYEGRDSGIKHMADAWQKCNEKVFGKARVNENADAS